jgi:RES domain-containing protein
MIVYRICKSAYAGDLAGTGARLAGGRWNSKGVPVVYTSGTRSLAVLEVLVHIPAAMVPKDFVIVSILIPDELGIDEVSWKQIKPEIDKQGIQADFSKLGNAWIKKLSAPVLKVPSVVVKDEYNYIINPLHNTSKDIKITEQKPFSFDARLF